MKRIPIIFLSFLFMTSMLSAQHVNFGFKAGLNLYNINSDDNNEFDSKIGFHAGVIGHMHLSKHYALQGEAVYSTQGRKYISSGANQKTNLGYINIPVLFQYMFNFGFRLEAGPQLGILISSKDDADIFIKDHYKTIDFGLALGASYIHVPTSFGIGVRYNHGLSDINNLSNATAKWYNQGFQLSLFYLLKHR